jgi:hypothetical protein
MLHAGIGDNEGTPGGFWLPLLLQLEDLNRKKKQNLPAELGAPAGGAGGAPSTTTQATAIQVAATQVSATQSAVF